MLPTKANLPEFLILLHLYLDLDHLHDVQMTLSRRQAWIRNALIKKEDNHGVDLRLRPSSIIGGSFIEAKWDHEDKSQID